MSELEVRYIEPEQVIAEKIASATYADILAALQRQGVIKDALPARQQDSLEVNLRAITPERTLNRIKKYPQLYYGGYDGDNLVVAARFNVWNRYDQAPYENFIKRAALSGLAHFRGEGLSTKSFGIHALLAVDESSPLDKQEEGFELLLQKAIQLAEWKPSFISNHHLYGDLRIGIPAGDILETSELLEKFDFKATNQYAKKVPHVPVLKQQLYIRTNIS